MTNTLTPEGLAVLDAALAYIDAHPDEWDQSTWMCGTSACVAGRIVLQNVPNFDPAEEVDYCGTALDLLGLKSDGRIHPMFGGDNNRLALTVWRQILAGESLPDLTGADLTGADLRGADLRGADLTGADLRGADLRGADLAGADLRRANLRGADLTGADLRRANLRRADLRRADLTGADLTGADLRGADLRGVKS
jgi:hypothetical protein